MSHRERAAVRRRALVAELATLDEGASIGDAARIVSRGLADIFSSASCVYRPELVDGGYKLGFCEPADWPSGYDLAREFDRFIQENPAFFRGYNPVHPDAPQRNVVLGDRDLAPVTASGATHTFYRRSGIAGRSQMRMLVCDGPLLLAWVGGFRNEPLVAADHRLLRSLLPAIRARLSLERSLRGASSGPLLEAAMNAIDAPAFLVTWRLGIVHANASGAMLLDGARSATLDRIRRAIPPAPGAGDLAIRVSPTGRSGTELWIVALRASPARGGRELDAATRAWRLTAREREVLDVLASGDANKDIATKLRCAVATVEVHVTSILRKARVESRSRLIASFWRGA